MSSFRLIFIILMIVPINNSWSQSAVEISTDFEGGNIGTIGKITETHWVCAVEGEVDSENRNRQASWYYFRLDNAKDKEITIDLANLTGEYNYKYGIRPISIETQPAISYDQENWEYLSKNQISYDEDCPILKMTFTPEKETVWIAHIQPYTNARLGRLLDKYKTDPMLTIGSIGKTAKNREMVMLTLTNGDIPQSDKTVFWLMARQHAWESGTSWVLEGLIHYLLDSKEGKKALRENIFKIIPIGDPDGVARGGVRFNAFGHDLNRNWDNVLPKEMPEIYSQKQAVSEWISQGNDIDCFITMHNTSSDYIAGTNIPQGHELIKNLTANSSFISDTGLRQFRREKDSIPKGRMSVVDALWYEKGIPSYVLEMNVRYVKSINRRRTVDDWLELGNSLGETLQSLKFD